MPTPNDAALEAAGGVMPATYMMPEHAPPRAEPVTSADPRANSASPSTGADQVPTANPVQPSFDLAACLFCEPRDTVPTHVVVRGDVWAVRTDGYTLVGTRMPGETPTPPDEERSALLAGLLDPTLAPTRLVGIAFRAFVGPRTCDVCKDRRTVHCRQCGGSGETIHRCDECDESHRARCHCETGRVHCPECSGRRVESRDMVIVGGTAFDARKIALVLRHAPADATLHLGVAADALRVVGDGWAAAIMMCHATDSERLSIPALDLPGGT